MSDAIASGPERPIRAGIAGLGRWGRTIVRSAADKQTGLDICAAHTRTPANAAPFCADHGITQHESFEALLADPRLEAVLLATPDGEHASQVQQAAAAGRHVFVEKPLALDIVSARAAIAAVQQARVVLAVGFCRRFHPSMLEVARRVRSGALGSIVSINAQQTNGVMPFLGPGAWRRDAEMRFLPPMNAIGVHLIDGMIQLAGAISEVHVAVGAGVPGCRDTVNVLLRFRSGISGTIFCSMATAPVFHFAVYGTKGVAEVSGAALDDFAFLLAPSEPPSGPLVPPPAERLQFPGFDMVQAELRAFGQAIRDGHAFPVSDEDVLHGMAVLDAVMESSRTGGAVRVGST